MANLVFKIVKIDSKNIYMKIILNKVKYNSFTLSYYNRI